MCNLDKYDVAIIGAGLGGLECANILSKDGMRVCVIEKNSVIGGCLQSYSRGGHVFDTGLHYVGSLGEGKILNQFFKYFGILEKIDFRQMASNFDIICYSNIQKEYMQGFANFKNRMIEYFPHEREGIEKYVNAIQYVFKSLSVDNLKNGIINESRLEYMEVSASSVIDNCVRDSELRNLLAGTVCLYGGVKNYSPFYEHAMIIGSNIDGAYRFKGGTQTIADSLAAGIRENGGDIFYSSAVTNLHCKNNSVEYIQIQNGKRIYAKNVISSVHPMLMLNLLSGEHDIRRAFVNRIKSLTNSIGFFTIDLILKKNRVRYVNSNYHIHVDAEFWNPLHYCVGNVSRDVFVSMRVPEDASEYVEEITLLCPMHIEELSKWIGTPVGRRGNDYVEFKNKKVETLLNVVKGYFPAIVENIEKIYTSTPLTYLNYTGTIDGSAYGILKNSNNPLLSLIPTRTKIKNLFQTGQNINVHGVLGVSLTSAITCSELLGREYLAKKIGNV